MNHPHALLPGSPAVWFGLALLLLVAGAACVENGRRRWKASVLVLAALVVLVGFESAVHSVHHLSDPEAATTCVLSSGSQHVPGACVAIHAPVAPQWRAEAPPAVDAGRVGSLQAFAAHEGRAPPAAPSV